VKYVLPVNNGTSACHLVAKCASQFHNKIQVIVPDNVYAAAWNAFLFDSSYDLYSVSCDINTWNYDMNELDIAINMHPNAAILIVHNIGNIINVPELKRKYPTKLFLEDNCEGFLGKYEDAYSGTESYTSAISFFGNKNITSGEGGAFVTNNENAYNFAKCTHAQGQSETRFVHSYLGYNYRMTNIQAALLFGQLEVLPDILSMKQELFNTYRNAFQNREDVLLQATELNTIHSNWMFGIRIPNSNYGRAELFFKTNNIDIRPMFYAINKHKYLQTNYCINYGKCVNAELLNKECVILPSYPELTKEEQNYVIHITNEYIKEVR
jgi:perosamine synthetase